MGGDRNRKDTSIVFYQSSSISQPYWQATGMSVGDGFSPASSECGTPILQRRSLSKRSSSVHGSMKRNKSSHKMPDIPLEIRLNEQLVVEKISRSPSPHNFGAFSPVNEGDFSRSKTIFDFPHLKKKNSNEISIEVPSSFITTPTSSTENLHKLNGAVRTDSNRQKEIILLENLDTVAKNYDDESTPLVDPLRNSGSERCLYSNLKETKFSKVYPDSDDTLSTSLPSIPKMIAKKKT